MRRVAILTLSVLAAPDVALACSWCVSSAFGDRSFNWPYLSLIVAPFVVGAAVAGVLVHQFIGFREFGRRLVRRRPIDESPGVVR